MIKFDLNLDYKISCLHGNEIIGAQLLYLVGIIIIFFTAFMPAVNAGCSCSGGTWDPTAFLNSELGGQPVQPSSAGSNANSNVNSAAATTKPEDRTDAFPNGDILKP